jgi:hypothetical protein
MKNVLMAVALAGALVAVGCEKKESESAKAADAAKETGNSATKSLTDAAGKAVEGAKDAGAKVVEGTTDAAAKAADAGKAAVDDAAAKAKDGILAEVKTKVDAIQGQLDGVKKQIDALPELVRKPAQDLFSGCEKKYTDLKAAFANLQKASGDEFKKLSGEVGSQATALSEEIGKIVKK